VLLDGKGRPTIQLSELALQSMDQAVFTIFHEVHHVKAAMGSKTVSTEAHANAFAASMFEAFNKMK